MQKKRKSYAANFQITMGPIVLVGKLYPVLKTGSSNYNQFPLICPDIDDPTRPSQVYKSPTGNTYKQSELDRAKEVDDKLVRISQEEYKKAKTPDIPKNFFNVQIHNAEDFGQRVMFDDKAYIFVPDTYNEYYDLVTLLVEKGEKVFVGIVNIRDNENFYQLRSVAGHLIVQRLMWPELVEPFEAHEPQAPSDDLLEAAGNFLDRLTVDFDEDNYRSQVKQKIEALTRSLVDGPVEVDESQPARAGNQNIVDLLNSFAS